MPKIGETHDIIRTRWLTRVNGRWRWRETVVVREEFMTDESGWTTGQWVPVSSVPLDRIVDAG